MPGSTRPPHVGLMPDLMPDLIRHLLNAGPDPATTMKPLQGTVYILTNKSNRVLYTGVTKNLRRRLAEHKLHINQGFSSKYNTEKLVYYEWYDRLDVAIKREKQLKRWRREWKEKLINDSNPEWKDLAEDIACNADYIQSVKDAYDSGQYIAGHPLNVDLPIQSVAP